VFKTGSYYVVQASLKLTIGFYTHCSLYFLGEKLVIDKWSGAKSQGMRRKFQNPNARQGFLFDVSGQIAWLWEDTGCMIDSGFPRSGSGGQCQVLGYKIDNSQLDGQS
jgi:hypothetical protein